MKRFYTKNLTDLINVNTCLETDQEVIKHIAHYCVDWINCIRNDKLSIDNKLNTTFNEDGTISWHSDNLNGNIRSIVKNYPNSSTYSDHIVKKTELENGKNVLLNQKSDKRIALMTVYHDGVIKFTKDIFDKASITQILNNEQDSIICYNPTIVIYYYIEIIENDIDNNEKYQWTLHYSFEPVDVEMLNRGNQAIAKDVVFSDSYQMFP